MMGIERNSQIERYVRRIDRTRFREAGVRDGEAGFENTSWVWAHGRW